MVIYGEMIDRVKGIEKWFVVITPEKCKRVLQTDVNWK